jgi:hypothetical protein
MQQEAPVEDIDQYLHYLNREAVADTAFSREALEDELGSPFRAPRGWIAKGLGGAGFVDVGADQWVAASADALPDAIPVNPHNTKDDLAAIFYHRSDTLTNPDGPKGFGQLVVWWGPIDSGARLHTLNVEGGTANYIRLGQNCAAPWNGTTPATPIAYTNRSAYLWRGGPGAITFVPGQPAGAPEDIPGGFSI